MEAGDYLTNALSITDIRSIQYYYLESSPSNPPTPVATLRRIEASWRSQGALVICDPQKSGLWVFGIRTNNNDQASLLPASVQADSSGLVKSDDTTLFIKTKGKYEPPSLNKLKTPALNASSAQSSPLSASPISSSTASPQSSGARNPQSATSGSPSLDFPTAHGTIKSEASPAPETSSPNPRELHEALISAVLAALVHRLQRDHGYIPLNARTLAVPHCLALRAEIPGTQLFPSDHIILATLDVSVTYLGKLIVTNSLRKCKGVTSIVLPPISREIQLQQIRGTEVWLAPRGLAAKVRNLEDETSQPDVTLAGGSLSPVEPPQTNRSPGYLDYLKSHFKSWFALQGYDLKRIESAGWFMVQIPARLPRPKIAEGGDTPGRAAAESCLVIPWPVSLCFARKSVEIPELPFPSSEDPKHAIRHSTSITYEDPLDFAEKWFLGSNERESAITKRQKDREAEAASKAQADSDAKALASTVLSPRGIRRTSGAGAMYPTPPDAILPAIGPTPMGATPSFDGTVSTPGNLPAPNLGNDHDITTAKEEANDGDVDIWDTPMDDHQGRSSSSLPMNGSSENLFGEIGGDLFGETVTDADFSFFDEPDVMEDIVHSKPAEMAPALPTLELPSPEKGPVFAPRTEPNNIPVEKNNTQIYSKTPVPSVKSISAKAGRPSNGLGLLPPPLPSIKTDIAPPVMPPIDTPTIVKQLFSSPLDTNGLETSHVARGRRKSSIFDPVQFGSTLAFVDQKYSALGQYRYDSEPKPRQALSATIIPQSEYLRRQSVNATDLKTLPSPGLQPTSPVVANDSSDQAHRNGATSSEPSPGALPPQNGITRVNDKIPTVVVGGLKRKREDEGTDQSVTGAASDMAPERPKPVLSPRMEASIATSLVLGDASEWSLTPFFVNFEPSTAAHIQSDRDMIAIAQMITDQAISTCFKIPGVDTCPGDFSSPWEDHVAELSPIRVQEDFESAAKSCLGSLKPCQLSNYLEIQDVSPPVQISRMIPRPMQNPRQNAAPDTSKSNILNIPPPHLEVRRNDTKLSVLPSAIPFWETLGLAACKGNKNVASICVYYDSSGMGENASIFLDRMQSSYETCRLGSHARLSTEDAPTGLMPIDTRNAAQSTILGRQEILTATKDSAVRLGMGLASADVNEKNIVVYFVYPPNDPELLVHICYGFQQLFEAYRNALRDRKVTPSNDLVLQLIPLDFIASPTCIVAPEPSSYTKYAIEVYDRCIDISSMSQCPAIILEEPLPSSIDFKLSSTPSASPLQENSCIHIAYTQSIDDRWITAAWTDSIGSSQQTASYCLARRGTPLSTPFHLIAQEIWQTTLSIIGSKRIKWRVMLAKTSVMERAEIDIWKQLGSASYGDLKISLTLLTVDSHPSLQLLPPVPSIPPSAFGPRDGPGGYSTPVGTPTTSTPNANNSNGTTTDSPGDSRTNMPTPSATPASVAENAPIELEPDATLHDIYESTYGLISYHRLSNSRSLLTPSPALISGYLLKRTGERKEDVPVLLEVNIVHSDAAAGQGQAGQAGPAGQGGMAQGGVAQAHAPAARAFEMVKLMKEVLGAYRGLATLARVRGVEDRRAGGRPWHVGASERGNRAVWALL